MRPIIRTVKQYVALNVHVSLALISLVIITYHYLDVSVDWHYVAFAFFSTLVAYTHIKNVPSGVALKMVISTVFTKSPWWIHLLSLICLWLALSFQIQQLLILLTLVLLCLGYCLPRPIFIKKNLKHVNSVSVQSSLRDYGAIKVIIVAIVWCGVSLLLPMNNQLIFDVKLAMICVAQSLWIIVLTIPFEIRDSNKDQLRHPTWPQKLGLRGTKVLGVVLWTLSLVLHYFAGWGVFGTSGQLSFIDLPFGVTMALTLFGLLRAKPNQSFWYSAFWIEAIPILWLTMTYLFSQMN